MEQLGKSIGSRRTWPPFEPGLVIRRKEPNLARLKARIGAKGDEAVAVERNPLSRGPFTRN